MVEEYEVFDILTGKISGSINRALLRAFAQAKLSITTEQWSVLACLWKKDRVTQQTLCDLTHKDKPSMTRLIDNLEKQRLVVRVSDATDRRKNLIHLTEKGSDIMPLTREVVREVVEKALKGVAADELSMGRTILRKIMANLEA